MALGACGGNDEVFPIDAATDAAAIDAPPAIDAPIDAAAGTPMCVTSVANLTVAEGANATFTVTLSAQPAATTTANLVVADATAASVAPAALTFTTANFDTPQTVTVTGVDDADPQDEATTVMCTVTGAAPVTVNVAVTDDD